MDKLRKIKEFINNLYVKRNKIGKYVSQGIIYVLLITISYVFLYPLFSMISLAFMSPTDIINPEIDWIPQSLYFGNFKVSIVVLDGYKALFNSFWFSGFLAVAQTVVSAMTGYAFARYDFKFKKLLFTLILVSFIIPVPLILIPRIMMKKMKSLKKP